jgi:transcriptional repressor NrdR
VRIVVGMQCPYCHHENTKVTDSRDTGVFSIRRRRECLDCHRRFTTYEHIEMSPIYIIKKDGRREKFEKNKMKHGVMKALEKRPVSHEQIETLLDNVEEKVRRNGKEEIQSTLVGEYVMDELKALDQVAYIRFASVYRSFADITLFEKEVQKLTSKA